MKTVETLEGRGNFRVIMTLVMKNMDGINANSKSQNPHLYIIVHVLGEGGMAW